jgi:SNF family Na+-dependent transporter
LGLGKYLAVIQMDQIKYRQLLKVRLVHQVCVTAGVTVVEISVSYMLLRLAVQRNHRWFLYGLIIFLVGFIIACTGTLGKLLPDYLFDIRLRIRQ